MKSFIVLGKRKIDNRCLYSFMIRIDGNQKERPTHRQVIEFLLNNYKETRSIVKDIIERLNNNAIIELIENYYNVLSAQKSKLITKYLIRKIQILSMIERGEIY